MRMNVSMSSIAYPIESMSVNMIWKGEYEVGFLEIDKFRNPLF